MSQPNRPNFELFFLFIRKELRALLGKKYTNVIFLTLLMALTFITIVFTEGSRQLLQQNMDDPFVLSTEFIIKSGNDKNTVNEARNRIDDDTTLKEKYYFNKTSGYHLLTCYFYKPEWVEYIRFDGRSIEFDDPINTVIDNMLNKPFGQYFTEETDLGLIVTKSMLQKLGYPSNIHYIPMDNYDKGNTLQPLLVPVRGVVEKLPNDADWACTPFFHQLRSRRGSDSPLLIDNVTSIDYFIGKTKFIEEKLLNQLDRACKELDSLSTNCDFIKNYGPYVHPVENVDFPDSKNIQITFTTNPGRVLLDSLHKNIMAADVLRDISSPERLHRLNRGSFPKPIPEEPDGISFNFTNLKKIRSFNNFLDSSLNDPDKGKIFSIDLAQVMSKENYSLVATLTRLGIILLISFSTFAIIYFLNQLVRNHLIKIKPNIGTFQAFGLDNRTLSRMYGLTILIFIAICLLISLAACGLFYLCFGNFLAGQIGIGDMSTNGLFFVVMNIWTYLVIILLLISSWLVNNMYLRRFFDNTPGDLVYGRD